MNSQDNAANSKIQGINIGRRLYVSTSPEPPQMFKSKFLDFLTHSHFLVIPFVYFPMIGFSLYKGGLSVFALELAICGCGFWTLAEYILHRFFFHWVPPGKYGERLHFIYHGVHHDYPNDKGRIVFAPILGLPLAYLHFIAFKFVLGLPNAYSFFAGFITGYVMYDMVHYALHHLNFKGNYFLKLKHSHMNHHFVDPDKGYGLTSPIWDYVFNTLFRK